MRNKYVAGNWKMNNTVEEGVALVKSLMNESISSEAQVIICPSFIHLPILADLIQESGFLSLGAQNCAAHPSGAFTGEVSVHMLKDYVDFVIIGHSERRTLFGETDEQIKQKIKLLLQEHIKPILCCGELRETREVGKHTPFVLNQLEVAIGHLDHIDVEKVIIAYEPVWAIGTGLTAGPDEAQEMHAAIRNWIKNKWDAQTADDVSILYGGSCNASNAKSLFAMPDVDGGLIGGASLQAKDFATIVQSFS